jgi:hypothetical protein
VSDQDRGIPTTVELVEAVRLYLQNEVLPQTDGKLSFHARVAANVLAGVERALEDDGAYDRAHASRLAELGAADDEDLARAIRDGQLDGRITEVVAALRASTTQLVAITNPRYLADGDEAAAGPPD